MLPINFPEANCVLKKPASMTEEECMSLPVYKGVDDAGYPFFMAVYKPSKEDTEAIKAGLPIYLKVLGNAFPPVSLFTVDEKGEPNF